MDYRAIYSTYTVDIPTGATYQVWNCDMSGNTLDMIYSGKVQGSGGTSPVDISVIARSVLDCGLGPYCFTGSTDTYVDMAGCAAVLVRYSTDNSNWTSLSPICFVNDWSYEGEEWDVHTVLSDPVNGHAVNGMYLPYSRVATEDLNICYDGGGLYYVNYMRYTTTDGIAVDPTNINGYQHDNHRFWSGWTNTYIGTEYLNGYGYWYFQSPVTDIPGDAFYNQRTLNWVELPASCKTIGWFAFEDCTSLSSITALRRSAPSLNRRVFQPSHTSGIPQGGTLYCPAGSYYYNWMRDEAYLLGYYNWTLQQI